MRRERDGRPRQSWADAADRRVRDAALAPRPRQELLAAGRRACPRPRARLAVRGDVHDHRADGLRADRLGGGDASRPDARPPHAARARGGAGAALVLLAVAAVSVLIAVIVVAGITGQSAELSAQAASGVDKLQSWLDSAGVDSSSASGATSAVKSAAPQIISTLTHGIVHGITGLASILFGMSLAALGTFFLLKDGPGMRDWVDGHVGLPRPLARTISGSVITSLRGYFKGVTFVAAFNGVIVGLAALLLDVPLAGTIAVVTFVTAYIPYLGAVVAGTFAVLLALGAHGTGVAVAMLVVVILANGLLQNLVQPFAMGSALDLNPLVVLVATIGAGCLFGMLGLVLAAPLVSAAVRVAKALDRPPEQAAEAPAPPEAAQGDALIPAG